ncbi:MAG: type II CAAX endopeptidase family protein [Thermoanaerobaculia bacterium]|nr:type II CAAX endopeptidase family protein [Thermoanaerobaculia bacterium]
MQILQTILPLVMAIGTAMMIDRLTEAKGLLPPNFRVAADTGAATGSLAVRQRAILLRSAAMGVVSLVLWIGVFAPLSFLGRQPETSPQNLSTPDLFVLHSIFLAGLAVWYLLGFVGSGRDAGTAWVEQLGLDVGGPGRRGLTREIGIGLAAGVAGWLGVIAALFAIAALLYLLGAESMLPTRAPEIITWVVALPVGVRVALSLSAGVVEELFFRGFLQPRIGIVLSSVLFVLAHLSYDQPFLLIGVALLSVLFAFLVRWRQSIWAAVVAHATFDAIQLLIVIPRALDLLEREESGLVALVIGGLAGL